MYGHIRLSLWKSVFDFLHTICWFLPFPVCGATNWIVEKKLTPAGLTPSWVLGEPQYVWLATMPLVNLSLTGLMFSPILLMGGTDVAVVWAGLTAITYQHNQSIHFDALSDTTDAMYAMPQRENQLRVMRDPHVGALALHNVSIHHIISAFILAALLHKLMTSPDVMFAIILVFFTLTLPRLFTIFLVEDHVNKGTFEADEKVSFQSPVFSTALLVFTCMLFILVVFTKPQETHLLSVLVSLAACRWAVWKYHKNTTQRIFSYMTGDIAGYLILKLEKATMLSALILAHIIY